MALVEAKLSPKNKKLMTKYWQITLDPDRAYPTFENAILVPLDERGKKAWARRLDEWLKDADESWKAFCKARGYK